MAWLTIDAGTSVIKAVIFAADGRELNAARASTMVLQPHPGWSEQDMHEVWAAVVNTVRQALSGVREPIRGIASTAQGDGCWLVDDTGAPTGNAILWNDARAAGVIEQWKQAGLVEAGYRRSGSVSYGGLPHAILSWLGQNQPERVDAARWLLTANGWLVAQMTGTYAADTTDAANPFGDLLRGGYSAETLVDLRLEAYERLLPPIVAWQSACFGLLENAANAFGLPPGLPVVMAPYDIAATAYGSGAVRPGQACVILGTTICAEAIVAEPDLEGKPMGTTLPLAHGLFLRAMPTLTGCEALHWAADLLGLPDIPSLEALAVASPTSTLFFLPYLSPAGERSPFLAPEASGSFHGLRFGETRGPMARAVYEGLSFTVRECLEAAAGGSLSEVSVCGGGAQSDFWCGMIADVLGVPVRRPADRENGARGAHLSALYATGEGASIREAAERHVRFARTFLPDPASMLHYGKAFRRWIELRKWAMGQWRVLGEGQ